MEKGRLLRIGRSNGGWGCGMPFGFFDPKKGILGLKTLFKTFFSVLRPKIENGKGCKFLGPLPYYSIECLTSFCVIRPLSLLHLMITL